VTRQHSEMYDRVPLEELLAQFTTRLRDVLEDLEAKSAPTIVVRKVITQNLESEPPPTIVVRKVTTTEVAAEPMQITVVRREARARPLTAADVYNAAGLPRDDEYFLPGRVGSWQRKLIRIPGAYRMARWLFRHTKRGRAEVQQREKLLSAT
jgi:hypothetical protein